MFILARIVGISIYVIAIFGFTNLIRYIKKEQLILALILFWGTLCCIAFAYEPHFTSYLYRIRIYARDFAQQTYQEFWDSIINQTTPLASTPAAMIYYRLLGRLKEEGWVAAVTCACVFLLIFNIVYDTYKRGATKYAVAAGLFIFFTGDIFITTIATIRSYLACTFVAFCIYREIIRHKFNIINIVLYVLAALFHAQGIILILLRVIFFVLFQKNSVRNKVLGLTIVIILGTLLFPLYRNILNNSLETMGGYLLDSNAYGYLWEIIICFLQLIIQMMIYITIKKNNIKINKEYLKFSGLLILISIVSFIQFAFMQRFSFFCAVIVLPNTIIALDKINIKMKNNIILIAIISLVITCTRGYLCSLKFW